MSDLIETLAGGGVTLIVSSLQSKSLNKDVAAYNAAGASNTSQYDALNSRRAALGALDTVTLVLGGVGVAAIVVSAVVLATGDNPNKYKTETQLKVGALELGVGLSGLWVHGAF